jgi:soluble lytic murein transglycosylase-like protein
MRRLAQSLCCLLLLAGMAWADGTLSARPGYQLQYDAHLKNGFTIRHTSHEAVGSKTRLWLSGQSYVDVESSDIEQFETVEVPMPPAPAPAAAPQQPAPRDIHEVVNSAGERTRIDPDFIASVIRAESGGNPRAVSPKGARGLMQLMPQTAEQLGVKNTFDPEANVDGGARYLATLLEQYHGDAQKALAAYNAGPHRVQQYRGVPPYRETRAYVARVINDFNRRKAPPKLAARRAAKARAAAPQASQRNSPPGL